MIGCWKSDGITVEYDLSRFISGSGRLESGAWGWRAKAGFFDEAGGPDAEGCYLSTGGHVRTRGVVPDQMDFGRSLPFVLDELKADAERMGITWVDPVLCYEGGWGRPGIPDGCPKIMGHEAARLGWGLCTDTEEHYHG